MTDSAQSEALLTSEQVKALNVEALRRAASKVCEYYEHPRSPVAHATRGQLERLVTGQATPSEVFAATELPAAGAISDDNAATDRFERAMQIISVALPGYDAELRKAVNEARTRAAVTAPPRVERSDEAVTFHDFNGDKASLPWVGSDDPHVPDMDRLAHYRPTFFRYALDCGAMQAEGGYIDVVRRMAVCDDPILLVGPPSVGKTELFLYLAACVKAPVFRLNGLKENSLADFIGGMVRSSDGGTSWLDGPVVQAMERGGWLLLDEVFKNEPDLLALIHEVHDTGRLVIKGDGGRLVKAAPGFRVIMTSNSGGHGDSDGRFVAEHVQDEATLSRVFACFHATWPAAEREQDIYVYAGLDREHAERLVEAFSDIRQGHERTGDPSHPVTLRDGLAFVRAMQSTGNQVGKALAMSVMAMADGPDRGTMAEIFQRHFGDEASPTGRELEDEEDEDDGDDGEPVAT